jgi:hypothetical protein
MTPLGHHAQTTPHQPSPHDPTFEPQENPHSGMGQIKWSGVIAQLAGAGPVSPISPQLDVVCFSAPWYTAPASNGSHAPSSRDGP